ncbi:hypothetical protein [Novosphingobium kunmingense]|uniref:hypothetical protein n=1 Tax=Novosphingobium kunmingense TaxID=1211806 RepID=UPI000C2B5991|nr:hypothetical protein [Novosphingobium kunmingense]
MDGPGWLPFDLLGQPVPPNKGCKGRPQHVPTAENLEKAVLLYAQRKSDADVAAALGISIPTLKEHYFSTRELQAIRRNARAFVEGELLARLNRDSLAGKTGATEKLLKRLDKAGLAALGERIKDRGKADKAKPLGKKEAQKQAAGEVKGRFAPRQAPPQLIH